MHAQTLAPLAGNRAWVYARRAELELARRRTGHALALAMRSCRLAPANPAANASIDIVRRRVGTILPSLDTVELVQAMDRVDGWLTPAEAALLARCVAATPSGGGARVVEIGSYRGRSTVAIALAIAASGRPLRLTAIDPHVGYAFADGRDTWQALTDTLCDNHVDQLVDVVRARSVDVVFEHPIGMVFIDGLHDAPSVRADHVHVAPHVTCGGLVVFHDYAEAFPGVVDVVNELLAGNDHELVGYVDSLVALRRL